MSISGYPKVWHVGHRATAGIFSSPVIVQEKVDGSQISFTKLDGKLWVRSKGALLVSGTDKVEKLTVDGMFQVGVEQIARRFELLPEGYIFRGEYLNKPKHNVLRYARVPDGNIVLFDVQRSPRGAEEWMNEYETVKIADHLGLEAVPTLYVGEIGSVEQLLELLERESFLGGPKIEGFVIKNHDVLTPFGDPAFAKFVSTAFKEKHGAEWKGANPNTKDLIFNLVEQHRTEARWRKAVQHLRERGVLQDDPRDIGLLMKELAEDFIAEEKDAIMEQLWHHYGRRVVRGVQGGFAEWYKRQLAEQAFTEDVA